MLPLAALALSVPLYFEPNQGQAPAQVRYLATTSQYSLYLSDTAITTNFSNGGSLRMNLPRSSPEGLGSLPGKTHYYAGSDPSMWLTVPQYARVRYRAVFPGVDLVVYGKQHQLEYDWVVAPGADPASIRFAFSGASTMRVDEHGDLVLAAAGGEIRHRRPKIYQMQNGQRLEVDGGFILARNGEVRFRVGEYDRRGTLIIDPELVFSTGFGGSPIRVNFPGTHSIVSDTGTGIALDGRQHLCRRNRLLHGFSFDSLGAARAAIGLLPTAVPLCRKAKL